ncbi:hypothetical protein B0I35DRAFT_478596 [Stachybotrys elegans]|uniref:Uncharacterized protein n=1 Tax=Stachybotrys elegans TaxID=80388 RepID=A0A8K0SQN9_9HYPO|nr:hypothetical protein B0I35DRAFT_478596 [Stachybotrys elegans]
MSPPLSPPLSESMKRRFSSLHSVSMLPSTDDQRRSHELMNQYRVESGKSRSGEYTIKDANPVLSKICRGQVAGCTPGMVQALLNQGADVNFERRKSTSLLKRFQEIDQDDVRNHILKDAMRNCSKDIVYVLAQSADPTSVSEALPAAVDSGDALKASIIMARGADASPLCDRFLATVDTGSIDMLEVLLRDTNGACQQCRDRGLMHAISQKDTRKACLLLSKRADPTYSNGAPIISSIQAGLEDVAVMAVSNAKGRLPVQFWDDALGHAYRQKLLNTLEACLVVGAKGPNTNTVLGAAVKTKDASLISLLLGYGADATSNNGAAIVAAVSTNNLKALQAFLQQRIPMHILVEAMKQTIRLKDLASAYVMVDMLLTVGVRGECISEVLTAVLDRKLMYGDEKRRSELARLLLLKGEADVNWNGGLPFTRAVASGYTEDVGLLVQFRPSIKTLEVSLKLANSIQDQSIRRRSIDLLLAAAPRGSESQLRLVAMAAAASEFNIDIVEYLAPFSQASQVIVMEGFTSAISGSKDWLSLPGLNVVKALLLRGAHGQNVNEAFCIAAGRCHREAFELLVPFISRECVERAFCSMVKATTEWQSDKNLWIVTSLLNMGCKGAHVNASLLTVLKSYVRRRASLDMVNTLLLDADVNYKEGEALKIAIQSADVALLENLAAQKLAKTSLSHAFATVILTPNEEHTVLSMIDVVMEASRASGETIDYDITVPLSRLSVIAACISVHPKSTTLVKKLISLGCNVNTKFLTSLYKDCEEASTVMSWAMANCRTVPIETVKILIEARADVDYTAPRSKTTALILAAQAQRADVVEALVEAKANPLTKDCFESTASFYASQSGNLTAVKALIRGKARPDDCSLHEAARNLHHEVVLELLKNKHNANFPSSRKEQCGRTALQELAYRCDDSEDMVRLEQTIEALMKYKADPLSRNAMSGKNSLFLAMENPKPLRVTRALLSKAMWSLVNDANNLYIVSNLETGTKWYYSPTMYLRKGCYQGDPKYVEGLQDLLLMNQCQDFYYPEYGPGDAGKYLPIDSVGAPKKIKDEDAARRKAELDHETAIRHMDEKAWKKVEIEDRRIDQKLEHSMRAHETDVINLSEKSQQQQDAIQRKNALVAAAQREAEEAKLRNLNISMVALQAEQKLKLDFREQQGKAKIGQQRMQNLLAQEAAAKKLVTQRSTQALAQEAAVNKLVVQRSAQALAQEAAAKKLAAQRSVQALRVEADKHQTRIRRKELNHQEAIHDWKMEEIRAKNARRS